jgi:hypothetical protein
VLADNAAMLHLAKSLGFRVRERLQNVVQVALDLSHSQSADGAR